MTEYHDHRDDCPFKFATLDACDCVEKNMLDRIEALIAERARRWRAIVAIGARADAAEAKLAKAVEGLKRICMQPDYRLPSPQEIARAALAEIKGESHE